MILVIDDDESIRASLALVLRPAGYEVEGAATPEAALAALGRSEVELALLDMNFSRLTTGEEGLELLRLLRERRPALPVVLITAWGSIELAVAGMKAGARDFITKPWTHEQILRAVRTALGLAATSAAPAPAPGRRELEERYGLEGVVGEDPRFLAALAVLARVAPTDASVLVTGETGTGKEVAAELVHRLSRRAGGPLVKVNLGGLPPGLFDSEMFGHVRGAFTDAREDRAGRVAVAAGGTLFLDEVGELDPICQVKLLRVLQDGSFEPLGSSRSLTADVRVVSATNRDLEGAIRAGRFREDLYYRLNLITVRLPSLAERPGDVPLLARHFLGRAAAGWGRPQAALAPGTGEWLASRPWPGNVRQLKHLVERALLLAAGDTVGVDDLRRAAELSASPAAGGGGGPVAAGPTTLEEMERGLILEALKRHGGNLSRVAEALGLSRQALYRRLEKHRIEP